MQKKIYLVLVSFVTAIVIFGCKNQKDSVNTLEDMQESEVVSLTDSVHISQNSLDWKGTYSGILPCADCMGIQFKITLKDNGQYETRSVYLGKSDSIYSKRGQYQWDDLGTTVICRIENKIVSRFKVKENFIELIGTQDSSPSNDLDKLYRLYKNEAEILNTYWELTEVLGNTIKGKQFAKKPYLLIKTDNFSATGGCNSIFGTFKRIEKGKKIQFLDLAVTEMACHSAHLDKELIEALNRTHQYLINGNELQLIVGKAAPLAKFKAIMH